MMMNLRLGAPALLAITAVATLSAPAMAQTVYSNNFNAENGGATLFNYTGFNGLTVSSGSVDIIKSGDYGITCVGGAGSCVDLDGTTNQAGVLTSSLFNYAALSRITLGLTVSGNQRSAAYGPDGLQFGFNFNTPTSGTYSFSTASGFTDTGSFSGSSFQFNGFGFLYNDPFDDLLFTITPTTAGSLNFYINGASVDPGDSNNDNLGIILDDVSLSITPAVPEPATWAMMLIGFGMVGFGMRASRKGKVATRVAFG